MAMDPYDWGPPPPVRGTSMGKNGPTSEKEKKKVWPFGGSGKKNQGEGNLSTGGGIHAWRMLSGSKFGSQTWVSTIAAKLGLTRPLGWCLCGCQ